MSNPKYDANNYKKWGAITINTKDDYQYFQKEGNKVYFESSELIIYWHRFSSLALAKDAIFQGKIRIREVTPLGAMKPRIIDLDIAPSRKDLFVQFTHISNYHPYTIEILNSEKIGSSSIEIWEYQSSIPSHNMSGTSNPGQTDPALIAAAQLIASNIAKADNANKRMFDDPTKELLTVDKFNAASCMAVLPSNAIRNIIGTNTGTATLKVFKGTALPPNDTPYIDAMGYVGQVVIPGGQFEFDDPECRGGIAILGSVSGQKVSISVTRETPFPLSTPNPL